MIDSLAGCQPLYVAGAITRSGAKGIGVVDETAPHDRHGLEAAMRMVGKAGDRFAVIHPPSILPFEILAETAALERCHRTHRLVPRRIVVDVMYAEEKRVRSLPRKAERSNREY